MRPIHGTHLKVTQPTLAQRMWAGMAAPDYHLKAVIEQLVYRKGGDPHREPYPRIQEEAHRSQPLHAAPGSTGMCPPPR